MFSCKPIENKIGYVFKNKNLLKTAFVHSSYANEHKVKSNERLEYLGDAVLEFIVTDKLYNTFNLSEGQLTKYRASLVTESTLAFVIEQLKLDQYLLKGKGEKKNNIDSKAIKCDLFEAVVGALYLDGGINEAQKFVVEVLETFFDSLKKDGLKNDAKSTLQEMLINQKIVYSTTKHGESHNPSYKCTVIINNQLMGFGQGTNKKAAEQEAAKNTIDMIKKA